MRFKVNASHPIPAYALRDEIISVYDDGDGYYATHSRLGCSKTFDTPLAAVRSLVRGTDATIISIKVVKEGEA